MPAVRSGFLRDPFTSIRERDEAVGNGAIAAGDTSDDRAALLPICAAHHGQEIDLTEVRDGHQKTVPPAPAGPPPHRPHRAQEPPRPADEPDMRARNRLASTALLIAVTATACAPMRPPLPPRRNVPLVRALLVERGILLQACRIVAEQRGLEVQRIDLATGRITAFSPVDDRPGMTTRERWRFRVADGTVSVQLFLETRDGDAWRTSPYLHPAYDHHRERAHLDAIHSAVGGLAHGATIPLARH